LRTAWVGRSSRFRIDRAEVPLAVGVAVDRRVADLPAATAVLLHVAAVLGAEFTAALHRRIFHQHGGVTTGRWP
jgi:hypothetical protein